MAGGLRPQIAAAAIRACSNALCTDFFEPQAAADQVVMLAGAVADGVDRRVVGAALRIDHDPVLDRQPGFAGKLDIGHRACANDDEVGVVLRMLANDALAFQAAHHRAGVDDDTFFTVQPGID